MGQKITRSIAIMETKTGRIITNYRKDGNMKTGKEIKADVLAIIAQTGNRSRETAARLFMQMTADMNGQLWHVKESV